MADVFGVLVMAGVLAVLTISWAYWLSPSKRAARRQLKHDLELRGRSDLRSEQARVLPAWVDAGFDAGGCDGGGC